VGCLATAGGLGGVVGPIGAGVIVQHLGFSVAFLVFAFIAASGAVLFIGWMPETRPRRPEVGDAGDSGFKTAPAHRHELVRGGGAVNG
jgi:MFS family permease